MNIYNHFIFFLFCQYIFRPISEKMAYNVLGWRRFASPNKGFAKQRPGLAKCGWREAWEWNDL